MQVHETQYSILANLDECSMQTKYIFIDNVNIFKMSKYKWKTDHEKRKFQQLLSTI
jgi:hypothetical protein